MGKSPNGIYITGGITVMLGGIVVFVSTFFLLDYKDGIPDETGSDNIGSVDFCDIPILKELCKTNDRFLAAAAIAITTGVVQIATSFFAWKKKLEIFAGASLVVAIGCLVSMVMALDRNALNHPLMTDPATVRAKAFVGSLIADLIFTVGAGVGCIVQAKK